MRWESRIARRSERLYVPSTGHGRGEGEAFGCPADELLGAKPFNGIGGSEIMERRRIVAAVGHTERVRLDGVADVSRTGQS